MPRVKLAKRLILALALVAMCLGVSAVYGQDEPPEYAGTRECHDCHRVLANEQAEMAHSLTLVDVAKADEDANPILADFDAGEDLRTVTLPGEDSARPFTADDVVFTLGVGRHVQAYVTQTGEDQYYVLPAEWNTVTGEWQTLDYAADWPDPAYDFVNQCAGCHTTAFDANTLTWQETGVQCEACHGPGSNHIEIADDAGGSISDEEYDAIQGAINFATDAQVCGRCHIRGTSADGMHPYPLGYTPGDNLLEQTGFVPASTDDTSQFFPTGHARLPNMQFNEWLESSHGDALATAQSSDDFGARCLTCHSVAQVRVDYLIDEDWVDPHDFDPLTTLDRHGFGVTCVSCHNPHEQDNPMFLRDDNTYSLCTNCHSNDTESDSIHHPVQEMFEGQAFVDEIKPVVGAHFSADDGPECVTCHMASIDTHSGVRESHTFKVVEPGQVADIEGLQAACTGCHTDIKDPAQMQGLIDGVQSNVGDRLVRARDAVTDETPTWVVTALDAIEGDGSRGIHNYAYTNAMLVAVEGELGLVNGTLSDSDVSAIVAETLPPAQATQALPQAPETQVGGLTFPSVILLGIFGAIVLVAAYMFFIRGGRDE